jgi:hypothetical protein
MEHRSVGPAVLEMRRSYLKDCINPAATIGTMNEAPAVLAADESFKSEREPVFHIVGESARNVT